MTGALPGSLFRKPDTVRMQPSIRPFLPTDHAAALSLWQSTPGVGVGAADQRQAIERFLARNPGLSFVAEQDGELLATVLCGHDGRRGLIHHLAVAAHARRRGLARALLLAALRALRAAGIDKCHLLVFRSNSEGMAFWHALSASERHELALFSLSTEVAP